MNEIKSALKIVVFSLLYSCSINAQTQDFAKTRQLNLNEDGTNYLKFSELLQGWIRSMEYDPGSTVFGYPKSSGTDIGIRRYRVLMYGQLTDRVFFYSQIGENNFNSIADRKLGFFVHDAFADYAIDKTKLSVGTGLTGWTGLSRLSASSTASIMGLDLPLFSEATNDVSDQFGRKLSVYVKGKLGKLDYRLSMAQPMAIQKTAGYANPPITTTAAFSPEPPKVQWNGYFQYQFLNQESNLTPYAAGTYLGKKKVFNIGAGFIYQKDAMWYLDNNNLTAHHDMAHLAADVFYDAPFGSKGQAISIYGNVTHFDFGQNYIRNSGPMNPANGTINAVATNGAFGNAFPMFGTGNVIYAQVGYKLKDNLIGKTTLMPYVSMQHANYEKLNQGMNYYDVGVNWLLAGHSSKFTVAYQNRPVFNASGNFSTDRGALVAQYQVSF